MLPYLHRGPSPFHASLRKHFSISTETDDAPRLYVLQPADGRAVHTIRPRRVRLCLARLQPRKRFLPLMTVQLGLTAELHAASNSP